jgi:GTP-binding protein
LDTPFVFEGQPILLIDTAGIRKRARIEEGVEHYGVLRALRAIARSDVVLLLIEGPQAVMAQDLHIVSYVLESCKGLVILVNKWDLVEKPDPLAYQEMVRERLVFMSYAPLVFISALRGWGIEQVLPAARRVYQDRMRRLPPAQVLKVVKEAVALRPPPLRGRKGFRLLSVVQTGVNPPTFLLEMTRSALPATYMRYLEGSLRQAFGYITPLKLVPKAKSSREKAARHSDKVGEGT